jgi:hypothetical protein
MATWRVRVFPTCVGFFTQGLARFQPYSRSWRALSNGLVPAFSPLFCGRGKTGLKAGPFLPSHAARKWTGNCTGFPVMFLKTGDFARV